MVSWQPYTIPCNFMVLTGTIKLYHVPYPLSRPSIRYHAPLKTVFIRTEKSKIKLESNYFIKSIFKQADSEKTKWNIINDSRNSTKFSQNIFYLKKCFDDVITDNYKMAQLLNYKFSKLGDYIGSACNFFTTNHRTSKNSFDFRFVTTKEVLLTLLGIQSTKLFYEIYQ